MAFSPTSLPLASLTRRLPQPPRFQVSRDPSRFALDVLEKARASRAAAVASVAHDKGGIHLVQEIDGVGHPVGKLSRQRSRALVRGIERLGGIDSSSGCDRAEFTVQINHEPTRVSAVITRTGRGVFCEVRFQGRDLAEGRYRRGLVAIGLSHAVGGMFHSICDEGRGLLLVCGPAGAGKTTTAYAALHEVDAFQAQAFTIEDTVAVDVPAVTQHRVDPASQLTMPRLLGELHAGPAGLVVVDQVRDAASALAALQAAAKRPVVATMDAQDAADALMQLLQLGAPAALVRSSVAAVVAQRLVRVLCEHCKRPCRPTPDLLRRLRQFHGDIRVYGRQRGGCEMCAHVGYRGRAPVYELLIVNDRIGAALHASPTRHSVRRVARAAGMVTLRECAVGLVRTGVTSMPEIIRRIP
jgi:type II secretory ATPase GspE/PulE/Tfp pilus assembly ATPase PilB-like protein